MSERTRSVGTLETRGIEQVPERERTARVRGLFPTWAGANITVLLLTMGAVLVARRLAFWQALVVAVAAPAVSFALVGVAGIAGRRGAAPGMALSRAVFGQRGNLLPGALIWTARWGWETINAVTGAYALLTVLDIGLGVRDGAALRVVALAGFVAATFAISGLGIRAVRACTAYAAVLFGVFSVLVLVYLLPTTDWSLVLGRPAGPSAAMLTGFGVIAAGGISWLPTAPDFTRYLPRTVSGGSIVAVTVAGACVVATPLILLGAVLAVGAPDLATAHDPVSFLGESLPTWIAVPYLLIALTGSLLINSLSMYSAGFTAQTLGFPVSRLSAVLVNAVISLVLGSVLMLTARGFLADFTAFLSLLAVTFSAWGGVFGADILRRPGYDGAALSDTGPTSAYWYRRGFCPAAVTAWAAGLGTGLLFLRSAWFDGPLAGGTFVGDYGLGWIVTIAVSGLLYLALPKPGVVAAGDPG